MLRPLVTVSINAITDRGAVCGAAGHGQCVWPTGHSRFGLRRCGEWETKESTVLFVPAGTAKGDATIESIPVRSERRIWRWFDARRLSLGENFPQDVKSNYILVPILCRGICIKKEIPPRANGCPRERDSGTWMNFCNALYYIQVCMR